MLDYYRNLVELEQVEPQALWQKKGEKLFLVDEDQHVVVDYDPTKFTEETKTPEELFGE